ILRWPVDRRWEPRAGNLHAGLCPGGGPKGPSLPGLGALAGQANPPGLPEQGERGAKPPEPQKPPDENLSENPAPLLTWRRGVLASAALSSPFSTAPRSPSRLPVFLSHHPFPPRPSFARSATRRRATAAVRPDGATAPRRCAHSGGLVSLSTSKPARSTASPI